MSNKLIAACLASVALAAIALPAAASASPELTHPTGTRLAVEGAGGRTKFTSTNIGAFKFLSGSTVIMECSKAILTGELTKNNGVSFEGNITTATLEGNGSEFDGMHECSGSPSIGSLTPTTNGGGVDGETIAGGTPWCLKSGASDTFTIRGGLCSAAPRNISFVLDTTVGNECKYGRAAVIGGTFTTHATGDAILTIPQTESTFTKESGGILCPTTFSIEAKFTLETDSATIEPLYIS